MRRENPPEEERVDRWESRPVLSRLLRVAIFLIPLIAGFVVGAIVARSLPDPRSAADVVMWWLIIIAASSVTATIVDRFARRLLPLSWLLQMTMLFPDKAPPRYRVAQRTGNVTELKRRIAAAQEGGDADLGEMSSLILSLATALSNHDRKTRGHSERTRAYTDMIAEEMGLATQDRDKLRWAALLHDVGKLEVSADVLNKDGSLDEEEWRQIRRHPIAGMRLVAPLVPWLGGWAQTIEHHHERWDGTGYPYGLAGTEINLGARIVSVADAYDVMTAGRNYQGAMSAAATREEIATMAGTQFDPAVVRALMSVSLGRLRWVAGPLAGVMQLPFLRGLPAFGRDATTILASGALMTTTLAAGLVTTLPTPIADQLGAADQVVAAEDPNTSLSPPDTASGPFSSTDGAIVAGGPGIGSDTANPLGPGAAAGTRSGDASGETGEAAAAGGDEDDEPAPGSPLLGDDRVVTPEDVPVLIDVLQNDTPGVGQLDSSSLRVVNGANLGTVAPQGGLLRYIPRPNLSGSDEFAYQVCDDADGCDTAVVTVEVTPVNDAPEAATEPAFVDEDAAVTHPLTVTDVDGDTVDCSIASAPASGQATVDPGCASFTYTPAPDFNGLDSVDLGISDGTTSVVLGVTINVTPMNDAPVANPDTASTPWSAAVTIPVTANDTDIDGDPLAVTVVGAPASGVAVAAGGSIVYTPTVGTPGSFEIAYQACDPGGLCAPSTATVSVTGVMVAVDDQFTTQRGGVIIIDPLANDLPGSGSIDRSTWSITTSPAHGTIRVTGARLQYRVDRAFVGTDSFTYSVCDTNGTCDSALVVIVVQEAEGR